MVSLQQVQQAQHLSSKSDTQQTKARHFCLAFFSQRTSFGEHALALRCPSKGHTAALLGSGATTYAPLARKCLRYMLGDIPVQPITQR